MQQLEYRVIDKHQSGGFCPDFWRRVHVAYFSIPCVRNPAPPKTFAQLQFPLCVISCLQLFKPAAFRYALLPIAEVVLATCVTSLKRQPNSLATQYHTAVRFR
jgi:hypothetical protein